MMLDYLGLSEQGAQLEQAIEATYAAGDRLTVDQGGSASTEDFAAAVIDALG